MQRFFDLLIDKAFHLFNLIRCHGGEMSEVETKTVFIHIGTCLFHVLAQNGAERLLKQMGRAVVLAGAHTALFTDL